MNYQQVLIKGRFDGVPREMLEWWLARILNEVPHRMMGATHGMVFEAKDDDRSALFPLEPQRMTTDMAHICVAACHARDDLENFRRTVTSTSQDAEDKSNE